VGAPVVDNCLSGYNSSVFAYGQTGAGKTHTMTGRVAGGGDAAAQEQVGDAPGSGVGRLAGRGVAFMMVNRLSGCSQLVSSSEKQRHAWGLQQPPSAFRQAPSPPPALCPAARPGAPRL
jgi:hypothetical protein